MEQWYMDLWSPTGNAATQLVNGKDNSCSLFWFIIPECLVYMCIREIPWFIKIELWMQKRHIARKRMRTQSPSPVPIQRPSFPGMRTPMLKKIWSRDRLIFKMGVHWLIRHLCIETTAWSSHSYHKVRQYWHPIGMLLWKWQSFFRPRLFISFPFLNITF